MQTPSPQALTPPPLPMFYRELQPLDPQRHLGCGVRTGRNFMAAAQANAVPLGVSEFPWASRHYPIVFGPEGPGGIPVAITAVVEGRNLFVDAQGAWEPGVYVPGYLRRYPFWAQVDPQSQQAHLWFDPQAGAVVPLQDDGDARPLFDFRGQPNAALNEIVQFCLQCLQDEFATAQFMAALHRERLLVDRHARIELAPGRFYELGGFRTVDVEAFHKLPEATLAQWVRNGWAALVAVHHWSLTYNWQQLVALHHRMEQQQQQQGPTGAEPALHHA